TNPAPASCATTPPTTFTVVPPPTITSVVPAQICAGGGDIVITGTGFGTDPNGVTVVITGPGGMQDATIVSVTDTQIHVHVNGGPPPGTYDVRVDNIDGCSATKAGALRVTPGVAVFFVDPPTVYNGISIQATIYVTGLLPEAQTVTVTIEPSGGGTVTT